MKSIDGGRTFTDAAGAARRQSRALDRSEGLALHDRTRTTAARTVSVRRRQDLVHAGQPADGAVLSRHRRRRVSRTASTAGSRTTARSIIKSRSDGRASATSDWQDGRRLRERVIGVDRKNPRYVYGGCYQGIFERDGHGDRPDARRSWRGRQLALTEPRRDQVPLQLDVRRSSCRSTTPNVDLPRRQRAVPHGRPRQDVGADLARPDAQRQGDAGLRAARRSRTKARAARCTATIFTIAESPHDAKPICVGTDDGLVQLTRDGGKTLDERDAGGRRRRSRERWSRCRRTMPRHGVSSRSAWTATATTRRTRSSPPTTARRGRAS